MNIEGLSWNMHKSPFFNSRRFGGQYDNLRGRYHDVENKIVVTSSGLLLIDDALKVAKEKNQPIDIERLKSLINASIANLQEVEKGLGLLRKLHIRLVTAMSITII